MAGIVAADTDNGEGIAGVAFRRVKVLPITVLGADGRGYDSDIVAGIVAAVDAGADVILMSFSAPGYSAVLQAAVDYAWAHDVVVVAATGNDGSTAAAYPAGDRGVIGVTATDRDDRLAPGSNSGPAAFMAAPGVDILTTDAGGGYQLDRGHVGGRGRGRGGGRPPARHGPGRHERRDRRAARAERRAGRHGGRDRERTARPGAGGDATRAPARSSRRACAGTADGGPFVGPYVAATVRTWTGGGGDDNWTHGRPTGAGRPRSPATTSCSRPGAARLSNTNNYAIGTAFNSITITGTGYTLAGNRVALGAAGLTVERGRPRPTPSASSCRTPRRSR